MIDPTPGGLARPKELWFFVPQSLGSIVYIGLTVLACGLAAVAAIDFTYILLSQ